jgi:choline dehydrogenase
MRTAWDHVIVGAGSAGATLAGRLSEDPHRRVLLIEAGGSAVSPLVSIPGLVEAAIGNRRLNWRYRGDDDPSLGGRALTWAAGHVLGGSSSINGMVYARGLPGDYDRWVAAGNPGWGWDDMVPYFRRMERWAGPPDPGRGADGPLSVRRFEETDAACASTMRALVALGVPPVDDLSAGIVEGIGLTQATQKRGWRHSAADAYLVGARGRPNLTIVTHARALKLLFEGARCVGVRLAWRGRIADIHAERETIVCAGAIGSPRLLLLSGVGPPADLRSHGIGIVHDLPGVGGNLNEHVNVRLSAFVDHRTYNTRRRGLSALSEGLRFLATGSGPASSPANHCQAFVRTDPGSPLADVQLQIMPLGFGTPAQMAQDGLTVVVSPCHPKTRGRVRLRSADPLDPPRITIALLQESSDRACLVRGCQLAYQALAAGPGQDLGGNIYAPESEPGSDAAWLAFIRETAALNWHPTSTCRMGPGRDGVVDGELRIRGLAGVSIVDASIMPSVTSGNTNGPVIAIAVRAAGIIADRTR